MIDTFLSTVCVVVVVGGGDQTVCPLSSRRSRKMGWNKAHPHCWRVLQALESTNDLNSVNFLPASGSVAAGVNIDLSDSTVAVNNAGKFGH